MSNKIRLRHLLPAGLFIAAIAGFATYGNGPAVVETAATTTAPEAAPTPAPSTTLPAGFVTLTRPYVWGESPGVAELQTILGVPADGVYGPQTRSAHQAALSYLEINDYEFPVSPAEQPPVVTQPERKPKYLEPAADLACGTNPDDLWTAYLPAFVSQGQDTGSQVRDYPRDSVNSGFWRVIEALINRAGPTSRPSCP